MALDTSLPAGDAVRAQARHENFPVASRLLPRRYRRHLLALYEFARTVDDVGDELAGDRLAALDELDQDIDRIWPGTATLPALQALAPTVHACGIPSAPLHRLVQANRQDQTVTRYETWDDLLGYCALSANPVGHLVLHVFDAATYDRMARSDDVCTALQVLEHAQDVVEDLARGRVYLPQQDLRRLGVREDDLRARPWGEAARELVRVQVDRAEELLRRGAPLVGTLPGFARLAVAGFVGGGLATVDALRAAGHDVSAGGPTPRPTRLLRHLLRAGVSGR